VASWLNLLHLEDYYDTLLGQGYDTIDALTDIAWEDLEEIGIKKLGTLSPPSANLWDSPVRTLSVTFSSCLVSI